jgi:beta-glucosidase
LKPGEKREVTVHLNKYAVSFWDITITGGKSKERGVWRAKEGIYKVFVGGSSDDLSLEGEFEVQEGFVWEGL